MPVLSLACHLPHNTPHIPSRYNNEQTSKQTKAIKNSYIYIYIYISCKCDTNRAGHFTLDAYASRPVACSTHVCKPSKRHCIIYEIVAPLLNKYCVSTIRRYHYYTKLDNNWIWAKYISYVYVYAYPYSLRLNTYIAPSFWSHRILPVRIIIQ